MTLCALPNRGFLLSTYTARMLRRRVRFRPPGVKPWTRFGTLGPVRSRLGLAWVIAPLILGAILLVAGWALLIR